MTKTLVLAVLCATAAYAGSAGEAEHSARLESRVDAALERILGPRRAAALVEVRGERVTKTEQSQISGTRAHESAAGTEIFDLPGYTKKGAPRPAIPVSGGTTMVQSATEETVREGSFAVSGVRAWLFLDKNLDDAAAAEAVRVSLEILAIEPDRGDTLKVVKTAFTPAWRAAFSRPRDARALMLLCLAAATFLFGVFLLRRRPQSVPAPQPSSAAPGPVRRISPLPPIDKGGRGL